MTDETENKKPPYNLDELYAAYCEFKQDAIQAILSEETDPKARQDIIRLGAPMSKREFAFGVRRMAQDPEKLKTWIENLEKGWQDGREQDFSWFKNGNEPER